MSNFFENYELYTQSNSIYCYENSNVLKNKLNIKDNAILRDLENKITFAGLLELQITELQGDFDKKHFLGLHKFLFGKLYSFAGEIRKEDIYKGETMFCSWQYVDEQLDNVFKQKIKLEKNLKGTKEDIVNYLVYLITELNIIHPFREGNGRTIREFIRILAKKYGYETNWQNLEKNELLDAMILSVKDDNLLKICVNKIIKKNS